MPEFTELILEWYANHARVLPWRGHPDPYAVWVSEIMLQQTRVDTVIPYFERWMRLFPTIEALAKATLQQVLSAWEGLGYYSRARNLHKSAREVFDRHGGNLPTEISQLRRLPGIGRYTAAAIASLAFNQDVATLDGNLRRVFARVFDVSTPADSPAGERMLWSLAQDYLPAGHAGDYNQALMDLGATICLPKKPLCLLCPVSVLCKSRGDPERRPVLKPRAVPPHRLKMAAIISRDRQVLLALRPAKGLLGGLWEFPAVSVSEFSAGDFQNALTEYYGLHVKPLVPLAEIEHAYTHFSLTESAWTCELLADVDRPELAWVPLAEMDSHPMGKVDRGIARKILTTLSGKSSSFSCK